MEADTINLSWLCFVIPFGVMILAAIWGIRSRVIYAKRIFSAQSSGEFKDMNSPEVKSKVRRLSLIALIGSGGVVISLAILMFQQLFWINMPFMVIVVLGGIFGITGAIAGFLMQKEINQRL